jgi:hypothetical protein
MLLNEGSPMPSLHLILQHVGLALRLSSTHPQLDTGEALAHAHAATLAATPEVSAELLLAMAFIESRFDTLGVSRVEGHKRRLGRYPSNVPPKRWRKGTSLYCGPLQTYAGTWEDCMKQRDLNVAYATAVKELAGWLRDKRVRGDITRALAGYGCGNRGVRTGKCNRYQGRVLWQAKRLDVPRDVRVASRS